MSLRHSVISVRQHIISLLQRQRPASHSSPSIDSSLTSVSLALPITTVDHRPTVSIFPNEIVEYVIDFLDPREREDRETLLACALTCRAWLPRSRYKLFYSVQFSDLEQLGRFGRLISAQPCLGHLVKELSIGLDEFPFSARSKVYGSFPFVLAGKLAKVERLRIEGLYSPLVTVPPVDARTHLLLSEFSTITRLEINDIRFSNLVDLERLICSLVSLSELLCDVMDWTRSGYSQNVSKKRVTAPKLRHLYVGATNQGWESIINFLLEKTSVEQLQRVTFPVIKTKDVKHIGKFLTALGTSLRHLAIGYRVGGYKNDFTPDEIGKILGLSHNTRLQSICLRSDNGAHWVSAILDQVTSDHVTFITIYVLPHEDDPYLDGLHCELIDEILSRPRFISLEKLVFEYRPQVDADWLKWLRREIPSRLPLSYARDIVRFEPWKDWYDVI
ncbi:hypothetical protein AcW1_008212 [Taiwanofungus camphoratus]|nr:hypothetical protein AcW1_008212 [Antrodia cinnamomea]